VCDEKPNSPTCQHGCSPSCFADDEPIAPDSVVYDEVAQTCSAAPASAPGVRPSSWRRTTQIERTAAHRLGCGAPPGVKMAGRRVVRDDARANL
jgi:hypothetical protein